MSFLVAITAWEPQPWIDRFRGLMPERRVFGLGEAFDPAEVRYVASWKHPPGSLAALPNLQVLFSLGAGVDHLIGDPLLPKVPLVRVVDADLTARMSEYVVLHCLMHLRRQRRHDEQQRRKIWFDDRFQPGAHEVRVGIMGLGVLGQDAARKLKVMGFDVAAWSRSPREVEDVQSFSGESGLTPFLARTDILVCLLPLTEATRGILNRSLFERLARDGKLGGPILINAGRGGLQVEADILAALEDGTLHAATLDVFETEPLPAHSPLWTHPAVTVTPHNAAMSNPDSIAEQIAEQVGAFERGEKLKNVVDPRLQY
ncbi:MAG TPA: glyoxylate/hydroxypyruvate reductase A [Beijerinckiaceae bacterium]|jgi:glyoxylate/hydroxypyruvate reductase A|nr:glyoxylate/hydroxypyruvate reductase [Microvirga sp.]HZB38885.1 glyoxylate/hydroxypyruvate reductase A [Beijerinckiaceae bacterium]